MSFPKWLENMVRRKSLNSLNFIDKALEELESSDSVKVKELLLNARRELVELEQDIPK